MHLPLDRQPGFKKWLHGGLFVLIGALIVLALGAATALAEGGEEGEGGPLPTDPVVVPEVETPVTPPVSLPESSPAPSASAPASKPSEPAPSSAGSGSTPTTRSGGGSGSSKPAPSTVNHNNVRGPTSSGTESSGANSTGGSGGGNSGSSPQSVEAGSSSPTAATAAPTRNLEKVANDLATRAGQAPAKGKKDRQAAVARLGKALGTALLGQSAAVSHPQQDQGPVWVPLPGKSKLPYMLLVLAVLALAALVVWTQFRGPRESRRWKSRVDHRTGSASGFTLAPGTYPSPDARPRPLRAAEADPDKVGPRDAPRRETPRRAPRRRAA
ncbi:MAG: hypothetical protein QOE56_1789 [Solirubrobacterales bacterium]|jgi:hypothetical protein|nr:hypothetical protein [Solirubrobacterales bacterium]